MNHTQAAPGSPWNTSAGRIFVMLAAFVTLACMARPVLSMERCIREAQQLDLREGVLDKYLYANAERLFLAPRKPRY